jgi:hypothetical protein
MKIALSRVHYPVRSLGPEGGSEFGFRVAPSDVRDAFLPTPGHLTVVSPPSTNCSRRYRNGSRRQTG